VTEPRDWDRELAAIDKVIQKTPAVPGPANAGAAPARNAPRPAPPAPPVVSKGAAFSTWLRVLLVLALAAAVPFWPYPHGCGVNLFIYLAVAGLLVIAGIWGAISSWRRYLARAHTISILVILWGLALVASEVLPRVGYAAQRAQWTCP
jgi:hypothetical protein